MSDEPHTLSADDLGPGLHGDVDPPSKFVQRWVAPSRMAETWLPSYFHLQYDVIDRSLADASRRWARLGDLVEQHAPETRKPHLTSARWIVESTSTSISISEGQQAQGLSDGTQLLPDKGIVLQLAGRNSLNVEYWDSSLYPGGGAASPDLLILTTTKAIDPAWLAWEIRTNELVEMQLKRMREGSIISRVDRSQLFALWLPLPSSEEQARGANILRGIIRENQSLVRAKVIIESAKRTQRAFIVTGVTIQDRLRQFEEYLLGEDWIGPESLFSLELVEGKQRFAIQRIQRGRQRSSTGSVITKRPMEVAVDHEWLEWSSSPDSLWKVFNSLLGEDDLPRAILAAIVGYSGFDSGHESATPQSIPSFDTWRQLFRSIWDLHGTLSPADWSQISGTWVAHAQEHSSPGADQAPHNSTDERPRGHSDGSESRQIEFIRRASRPILALKAIHEGRVVRIFLILGPDQTDDPAKALALLDGYSSILAENLNRATHFAAEAAKKESLRRLSWLRHHLNGPIGIASNAIDDIKVFLRHNPSIAAELVPSKEIAHRMAVRPGREMRDYTMGARLGVIEREIERLKKLSDRVKQLSEIGAEEAMTPLDVGQLLRERAKNCKDLVPDLVVESSRCMTSALINGNESQLCEVFDEILFNACREFTEQRTTEPCLGLALKIVDRTVDIEIRDNAMPTADSLPPNPFLEGVTKYRQGGGGTGLGLTYVREILGLHAGGCSLEENRDAGGNRLAGVTFKLTFPVSTGGETE